MDGFVGALLGALATIVAVGLTVKAAQKHAQSERDIELCMRLGSICAHLDRMIVWKQMDTAEAGPRDYMDLQVVSAGLAALVWKREPTFRQGLVLLSQAAVDAMAPAAKVDWATGAAETDHLRVRLIALSQWLVRWMQDPAAVRARRFEPNDAIKNGEEVLARTRAAD